MGRWQPFPLVGGAYTDPAKSWSHQDTVNLLPTKAERTATRTADKLAMVPGSRVFAGVGTGPHRGGRDVEGKCFVVSGNKLYQVLPTGVSVVLGTVPGVGPVCMTHNQITNGNQLVIGNGSDGYVYNTATSTFAKISDTGFPGFVTCDFIGQYIVGVEPQRRFWFHSNLEDATDYSTLDRYDAESSPDRIVGTIVSHSDVLVFGERTTEFWTNTPTDTSAFQRNDGMTAERGCANANTIKRLDNSVFWLADNLTICKFENGATPIPVSTRAMEREIGQRDPAKAFAYTWEDGGHAVYYITWQDGKTWGWDVTQGEWHRRESFGLDRWRFNTMFKWNGDWYAGDYNSGDLHRLDWGYALEGCDPIRRRRITGVSHSNENPLFVHGLRVLIDTQGVESSAHAGATLLGALPDVKFGDVVHYQYVISGAYPGQTGIVTVLSGALPTGLSISAGGLVTGTTGANGTFNWTLLITDECGNTATLSDTASIASNGSWMLSGVAASLVNSIHTSPYAATTWTTTGAQSQVGYLYGVGSTVYNSTAGTNAERFSTNNGGSWTDISAASNTVSSGGGRMAFGGGYIFLCGGIQPLQRRLISSGGWSDSGSNTSRANDAVYHAGNIVVVSIYAYGASISTDNGTTWAYGSGDYTAGYAGTPLLATDGVTLVAAYNDGSPTYRAKISSSSDGGQTWTLRYTFANPGTTNYIASIKQYQGHWIVATATGQVAYTTTPMGSWSLSATTIGRSEQIAGGAGKLLVVETSGTAESSIDFGVTWQSVTGLPAQYSAQGIAWVLT